MHTNSTQIMSNDSCAYSRYQAQQAADLAKQKAACVEKLTSAQGKVRRAARRAAARAVVQVSSGNLVKWSTGVSSRM